MAQYARRFKNFQGLAMRLTTIVGLALASGLAAPVAMAQSVSLKSPADFAAGGLGALVGSRKAKLWDLFVDRWRSKTKRADGRLTDAFMSLFAEAYDKLQDKSG